MTVDHLQTRLHRRGSIESVIMSLPSEACHCKGPWVSKRIRGEVVLDRVHERRR